MRSLPGLALLLAASCPADSVQERMGTKTESRPFPASIEGDTSLSALALAVMVPDSGVPALVLFHNGTVPQSLDRRKPEDMALYQVARDSRSMREMLTDFRIENVSMAQRLFRVVMVDVAAVDPKASPAVNRLKAPFLAVLGGDGKAGKTIGPGIWVKDEILRAMEAVLRPDLSLGKYLEMEHKLVADELVKYDSLMEDIAAKRRMQEQAAALGSGAAGNLSAAIAKLEEEAVKARSEIEEQKARIDKLIAEADANRRKRTRPKEPDPKEEKPKKGDYDVGETP